MTDLQDETRRAELRRRMRVMLIFLGVLFGSVFLYKLTVGLIQKHMMRSQSHVVTVSSMIASYSNWNSELHAVGNVRAIRGVNVTTELPGMVRDIYFVPGTQVAAGALLVSLNIDADVAALHALQATAEINQITYRRDKAQFTVKGVSKEVVDTDEANVKNIVAQVAQQQATIDKKIIRAPFAGRLGISQVNPGQYLNPGDSVVTLQQLDPIYIDFYVPQQDLPKLKLNQPVVFTVDTLPGKSFHGLITTINPIVDATTRNVEIEATVANPTFDLIPGLFVTVNVNIGKPRRFITLPQTAIAFNAYGDIVYIVKDEKKSASDKSKLVAYQTFVTEGETRGEQVEILSGIHEGDQVVTSGQLKLKNGVEVKINNAITPSDSATPQLPNTH